MNAFIDNAAVLARPWYREFWVWFVIALPLSVVIAGISTVVIAMHGADSLVVDGFQKVGLVTRRETALERRAQELDIVAVTALDRESGRVMVRLQGEVQPETLELTLHHPTRQAFDVATTLVRDETGLFRGVLQGELAGHWHIRIADRENQWRITSRLPAEQQLIELRGASQ